MLGQLSSPPAACNKSNKSDDETPSRKESFYGGLAEALGC
jgi:hypothetical protein